MTVMLRTPHKIYKRYQSLIEGGMAATSLALLVAAVLLKIPVYPPNWAPVIVATVALIAFRWPLPAYIVAVLVLLYPIYSISLYLAILFLAISILIHRPASHYLGATVMILAVPVLAKYHLHWTVPVLAGLWWGSINGFWIGGAAALWGKLVNGMAGISMDWLVIAGQSPTIAGMMQRFNGLTSLETLNKLAQPFALDTTILLYHLLQIIAWALVALIVGMLASQKWLYHRYPWSSVGVAATGIVSLGAGLILLAMWLTDIDLVQFDFQPILMAAVVGFLVSSVLDVTRQSLELPVAPKMHRRIITVPVSKSKGHQDTATSSSRTQVQRQPAPVPLPDLPEWEPPAEDNSDLILLELD